MNDGMKRRTFRLPPDAEAAIVEAYARDVPTEGVLAVAKEHGVDTATYALAVNDGMKQEASVLAEAFVAWWKRMNNRPRKARG